MTPNWSRILAGSLGGLFVAVLAVVAVVALLRPDAPLPDVPIVVARIDAPAEATDVFPHGPTFSPAQPSSADAGEPRVDPTPTTPAAAPRPANAPSSRGAEKVGGVVSPADSGESRPAVDSPASRPRQRGPAARPTSRPRPVDEPPFKEPTFKEPPSDEPPSEEQSSNSRVERSAPAASAPAPAPGAQAPGASDRQGLASMHPAAQFDHVVVRDHGERVVLRGTVDLTPTLERIDAGERLSFPDDGAVFQNRERRLPAKPRGYYHEYVVPTPSVSGPGPQRLVVGEAGEVYYSSDHYHSFRRLP